MSFTAPCMGERDLARFIAERIACGGKGLNYWALAPISLSQRLSRALRFSVAP